jgi:hypothetical protein
MPALFQRGRHGEHGALLSRLDYRADLGRAAQRGRNRRQRVKRDGLCGRCLQSTGRYDWQGQQHDDRAADLGQSENTTHAFHLAPTVADAAEVADSNPSS